MGIFLAKRLRKYRKILSSRAIISLELNLYQRVCLVLPYPVTRCCGRVSFYFCIDWQNDVGLHNYQAAQVPNTCWEQKKAHVWKSRTSKILFVWLWTSASGPGSFRQSRHYSRQVNRDVVRKTCGRAFVMKSHVPIFKCTLKKHWLRSLERPRRWM